MNPLFRILARNTASTFVFQPIQIIIGLVTFGVLLRTLGAEKYGLIILAHTIIGNFNILDMGVSGSLVKYIPEFKASGKNPEINELISGAAILFIAIGIITCSALAVFTYIDGIKIFQISSANYGSARNLLYMAALLSTLIWPSKILEGSLRGFNEYHILNILTFMEATFRSLILILLAYFNFSIESIFLCSNFPFIIFAFVKLYSLKIVYPAFIFQFSKTSMQRLKEIIHYSSRLFIMDLSSIMKQEFDRLLVSSVLGVQFLPVYNAIKRPMAFISTFISMFKQSILPIASELYTKKNKLDLNKILINLSRFGNSFYAPLVCILVLIMTPFIRLWIGEEYVQYVWIAQIGLLFQLINLTKFVVNISVLGMGMIVSFQAFFAITSAAVTNVMTFFLLKLIGVEGGVMAIVFTESLLLPLWYLIVFKHMDFSIWHFFKQVTIKGQWTSWMVILLLFPFMGYFNKIDSWYELLIHSLILAIVFYVPIWIFSVEDTIKIKFYDFLRLFNDKYIKVKILITKGGE